MVNDNSEPDIIDYLTRARNWQPVTSSIAKPKPMAEDGKIKQLPETLEPQSQPGRNDATQDDDTPEAA